jgi:signal transduction histidine kinase
VARGRGSIGRVNGIAHPADGRRRWPWLICAGVVAGLVPTIVLSVRNRSFDEEPLFIPVAVMMILGYSTVGALLLSRTRRNPIGWLLMAVGTIFLLTGLSDEYLQRMQATGDLDRPLLGLTALVTSILWLPMLTIIAALVLLFPTGTVPGRRWRPLPWLIVAAVAAYLVSSILDAGPLDPEETGITGVVVMNPAGVEALGPLTSILGAVGTAVGLLCIPACLAAPIVRFRRATGEERQQIRWLAYVVGTGAVLVLLQIAIGLIPGEPRLAALALAALFLVTFALVGLGIPITIAVAVLRYRLYDLDVVVKKTVVFVIVAALVTAIGVAVAILAGLGVVPSMYDTPALLLLLGLGYGLLAIPLYRLARRIADRIVYGGRATPYEILTEFSGRVGETYSTEDVLPRMAQLLADATGATTAHVWLRVGSEFRAAASWPFGEEPPAAVSSSGDTMPPLPGHAIEVRHQGELLGALSVEMPASDPMRPSKERIVRDLAAQAGLVLRNVQLIEELRESRRRIVAAQDDRAKKLERNIHDGAQQQLVALSVKTRLAESLAAKDPERSAAMLREIRSDLTEALENLRDLARGIYPPLLADQGLAAALTAQARKSPVPVTVDADGAGRFPPDVEATVYFSVLEALQNVAKYADASRATVSLAIEDRVLRFTVTDDGRGFDAATAAHGSGLQGIADRLSAVGGALEVASAPGSGTTISGRVPIDGVAT